MGPESAQTDRFPMYRNSHLSYPDPYDTVELLLQNFIAKEKRKLRKRSCSLSRGVDEHEFFPSVRIWLKRVPDFDFSFTHAAGNGLITMSREKSPEEIDEIIDEFIEEDKQFRKTRAHSFGGAHDYIYSEQMGGWLLPEDMEYNDEKLPDEQELRRRAKLAEKNRKKREKMRLERKRKFGDEAQDKGAEDEQSCSASSAKRLERMTKMKHERDCKRGKVAMEEGMEVDSPDLRTNGDVKNGHGSEDIEMNGTRKEETSRRNGTEDPSVKVRCGNNEFKRSEGKIDESKVLEICLSTTAILERNTQRREEEKKCLRAYRDAANPTLAHGSPNHKWGALAIMKNQETLEIVEQNVVGLTKEVASFIMSYGFFRTVNELLVGRLRVLATFAATFHNKTPTKLNDIDDEVMAVRYLHLVYMNVPMSRLFYHQDNCAEEGQTWDDKAAAFLLKPETIKDVCVTLKKFRTFFKAQPVTLDDIDNDYQRVQSPRAKEELLRLMTLRTCIGDILHRMSTDDDDEEEDEDMFAPNDILA